MADKVEMCTCEKCGNEAEMTVKCEMVELHTASGAVEKKQKETRRCKICGNEADLIVDFD